jgi:formylglycine-generating enzyme required for sulfatase activity
MREKQMPRVTVKEILLIACLLIAGSQAQAQGTSGPKEFRDCEHCPEMVEISGGTFRMGAKAAEHLRLHPQGCSGSGYDNEFPVRDVRIARFAIGKYEVTVKEFSEFVRDTGRVVTGCLFLGPQGFELNPSRSWNNLPWGKFLLHPVSCVSWEDAIAYAEWLHAKTGRNYRLPSEAEWEFVARAGSQTPWPWGENPDEACSHANLGDELFRQQFPLYGGPNWPFARCKDGYVVTAPVGSFAPNVFGVFDMIGNVWEWVQDCRSGYRRAPHDGSPVLSGWGVDCSHRRMRGGGWHTQPPHARSATRLSFPPTHRIFHVGFRVACSLE